MDRCCEPFRGVSIEQALIKSPTHHAKVCEALQTHKAEPSLNNITDCSIRVSSLSLSLSLRGIEEKKEERIPEESIGQACKWISSSALFSKDLVREKNKQTELQRARLNDGEY